MTKKITFKLPAEAVAGASEVILLGDFNDWNPEAAPKLEKQSDESYNTVLELEIGRTYNYRFMLDDGRWVNDYNAQKYEAVPGLNVDNCVITVLETVLEEVTDKAPQKAIVKKEPAVKLKPASDVAAVEGVKPVAKVAKKTAAKTSAAKEGTAKSVKTKSAAKAPTTKVEKPAKAAKKAATPKTKKQD